MTPGEAYELTVEKAAEALYAFGLHQADKWEDEQDAGKEHYRSIARAALLAIGLGPQSWVAPWEADVEMLQNGRVAHRSTRVPGVCGMTIEAQAKAECTRERACYAAMRDAHLARREP